MYTTPITINGIKKLEKELYELKNYKRPKIINSIIEARQHGDLKENAEYHAAKEEQLFCENRIREIESKLCCAQIVDIKNIYFNGKVTFGSTIKVLNIDINKIFTFCIVGNDESDYKKNLISVNSPIAKALIGKKVSDIVIVNTPGGKVSYKILSIKYI
ncbi:transcription elongation factor GreA [Buchnera aphidicola]|uniref:Transcription elongation factor GreA n=1 Tax=Buchnera aphidicola (Stegophylla sp.) TaxID=2315800 RepID=A0A4D6Y8V6_9GAMM|nr:transcription elongation factor GreA [Buchnera aphidicola (Stegophylla sp.)]QCI26406.1 transcription elongation factor GreA [Buchnera aphidicola (Stegophylla sp.)]